MSLLRDQVEREKARRDARVLHPMAGGRSGLPALVSGGTRQHGKSPSGKTINVATASPESATPALVLLSADAVAVADDDPQPVSFGTVVRQHLLEFEADTSAFPWPFSGSVQFWVEGAWDDLDPGDGIVEILVDDVVVWSMRAATGHDGVSVVLETTDVAIADVTDVDIEFDTIVQNERHSVEVPVTGITWPLASIVQFSVVGRWNGYPANELETVQVLVDDVVVWPPSWSPIPGEEF